MGHKLHKDFPICWVTHPDKPNETGSARSRKLHLQDRRDHKKSICGMKFVEYAREHCDREICKSCLLKTESAEFTAVNVMPKVITFLRKLQTGKFENEAVEMVAEILLKELEGIDGD